jgi:tetratricopeptide (TPR) repeat protein/serine/threonine protein kinase
MSDVKADPKAIFLEALECPGREELLRFLDGACGGDPALRARVEELLRAHRDAGSFLEEPAAGPVVTVDEQPVREGPGTVIGSYQLLEQIGEGGFGVVFMAEQQQPVRRKVALKVLKPGMDTRQVVARFEAERQALALMDHPHIARVFDGGTTLSGRPYFVMELVKGVPITEFCDHNRLTPRQRLELFVPVCQAVQHAHQKGIIHRDLKPSNILVVLHDTRPVPKVIDFGIAKALGQHLTDKTLFTGFAQMVGTPLYMSPEQAGQSGLDIDTRSDVYSLGVLLYELLTGTTPFPKERFQQAAYDEIRRIIREEEPPRPSTRLSEARDTLPSISTRRQTEPAKLTKLVRGELDWVVMKALEKDRNRRYESANAFAADVQRYLNDEPVLACPPSAGYRLRKFVRRNKLAVAVAGLVVFFLVVLGGGAGWTVGDRIARRARVAGQVELILQEVEQLEHAQKWPEALVAARRAEAVLAGSEADPATQDKVLRAIADLELVQELEGVRLRSSDLWKGSKYALDEISSNYARVFEKYGVDVQALSVDESAARLRARPAVVVAVAQALDDWSGWEYQAKNKKLFEKLLTLAGAIDPDSWRAQLRRAIVRDDREVLIKMAQHPNTAGQPPNSQLLLVRSLGALQPALAVSLLEKACVAYPNDFWIHFNLAHLNGEYLKRPEAATRHLIAARALRPSTVTVWHNLGASYLDLEKWDEAIACCHKILALNPRHAGAHNVLGLVLKKQGKLPEALAKFRKAVELNPDDVVVYRNLGNTLVALRKPDEALPYLRRAIQLKPKFAPAHDLLGTALNRVGKSTEAVASYQKAIALDPKEASAYANLASALDDLGKLEEARANCEKALALDPKHGMAHNNLAAVLSHQGKPEEAIARLKKAIEVEPKLALPYNGLGVAMKKQGKLDEAVAWHRQAIALDPTDPLSQCYLGDALEAQSKLDEAIDCFRKALQLDPNHVVAHYSLGNALARQKKLDEAIVHLSRAAELDPKAQTLNNLGNLLDDKNEIDKAIACYRKAIAVDPNYPHAHYNLGIALAAQKKLDEAIDCFRRAIELNPKDDQAHCNLGYALLTQGKAEAACDCFRHAIKLEPTNIMAHLNLGAALMELKKLDEAVTALRRAVELFPKDARPLCNLGVVLRRQGKLVEAIATYRKALELDADNADIRTNLRKALRQRFDEGVAHYRAGRWTAAVEALHQVRELSGGGDAGVLFFLAMTYQRMDKKAEARQWYDQAVRWMEKHLPVNEVLRRYRAEAEEVLGIQKDGK